MNIIELAKEAGIPCFAGMYVVTEPAELERFAALVAAHERNKYLDKLAEAIDLSVKAEREACAKVCDETRYTGYSPPEDGAAPEYYDAAAESCAAAIRARSEK